MGEFEIKCLECGKNYDTGHVIYCKNDTSLLRTYYSAKRLELKNAPGLGKFHDWLPVQKILDTTASPATFKSEGLAEYLGLSNLYIAFSGYLPEKGATLKTCSFKELEAHTTMQWVTECGGHALVVASVGNTARAFAYASALTGIDAYIIVPPSALKKMWLPVPPTDSIHLITMEKGNDYADGIELAERLAEVPGIFPEGGARNVARRDGMACAMLEAVISMGKIPDHYFQAVGTGTGAIAAWEACLRLRDDGRFGNNLPKLQLAQNLPFAPILHAWEAGRREIIPEIDMPNAKEQIKQIYADVLSNRNPPYSITGGIYYALTDTDGIMYGVTNDEAGDAKKLFEKLEGIDILAPSAFATAALIRAVEEGNVLPDDYILLHATGGGFERLKQDISIYTIEPTMTVSGSDADVEEIVNFQRSQ